MTVAIERSIRAQIDHFVAVQQAFEAVIASRPATALQDLVAGTEDFAYQRRISSNILSRLDGAISRVRYGSIFSWIEAHDAYFDELGEVSLESGMEGYNAAFPGEFAVLYKLSTGLDLASELVWPFSYRSFGTWLAAGGPNTLTYTEASDLPVVDPLVCRGEGLIRLEAKSLIGGSTLNATATLVRADDSTYAWSAAMPSGSAIGTQVGLKRAITGSIGSVTNATIVSNVNPSTFGLIAGQWVVISSVSGYGFNYEAKTEAVQVVSITAASPNYNIVVTPAPVNTFGSSFYLEPCWAGVDGMVHASGGTNGDTVSLMFAPDRAFDRDFTQLFA